MAITANAPSDTSCLHITPRRFLGHTWCMKAAKWTTSLIRLYICQTHLPNITPPNTSLYATQIPQYSTLNFHLHLSPTNRSIIFTTTHKRNSIRSTSTSFSPLFFQLLRLPCEVNKEEPQIVNDAYSFIPIEVFLTKPI